MVSYSIDAAEEHRRVLNLSAPFNRRDLKRRYRTLISRWHPDRFHSSPAAKQAEATEKAKRINLAYEYLSEYLDENGGTYRGPATTTSRTSTSWSDLQPQRRYDGKSYTPGFPDPDVTEIFVKSSHIVSAAFNPDDQVMYLKFSDNSIYRYSDVPQSTFDAFMDAPSHGKFAHEHIYSDYEYERL